MGKVLIIKDADFSVNAIETIVPDVLISEQTFTTAELIMKIFNRTGDVVDVSSSSIYYSSHFIAVPNGCTKVMVTSANGDLAPNWFHCFNSSTPSNATWLGISEDMSYDSYNRGAANLNDMITLKTGTTYIGGISVSGTASDLPITIRFYQ